MTYRYYITDTYDGCVKGTNSSEMAEQFSESDDHFVVDTKFGLWLQPHGKSCEVKDMEQ